MNVISTQIYRLRYQFYLSHQKHRKNGLHSLVMIFPLLLIHVHLLTQRATKKKQMKKSELKVTLKTCVNLYFKLRFIPRVNSIVCLLRLNIPTDYEFLFSCCILLLLLLILRLPLMGFNVCIII